MPFSALSSWMKPDGLFRRNSDPAHARIDLHMDRRLAVPRLQRRGGQRLRNRQVETRPASDASAAIASACSGNTGTHDQDRALRCPPRAVPFPPRPAQRPAYAAPQCQQTPGNGHRPWPYAWAFTTARTFRPPARRITSSKLCVERIQVDNAPPSAGPHAGRRPAAPGDRRRCVSGWCSH